MAGTSAAFLLSGISYSRGGLAAAAAAGAAFEAALLAGSLAYVWLEPDLPAGPPAAPKRGAASAFEAVCKQLPQAGGGPDAWVPLGESWPGRP